MRDPEMMPAPGRGMLAPLLLIVALASAAHLAFSSLGFNTTDDGFVLAMSRRLIDGQVPHRDFISIRPVGSALLHVPVVLFGGASTLWIGRWVAWCELAIASWLWVVLLDRLMHAGWSFRERALLTSVGFFLSSHTFPVMPWYTIDGMVLGTAGMVLASTPRSLARNAGFFLVGLAALCKQNFLALIPIALFFFQGYSSLRSWLASMAPLLLYAVYVLATGAARDAVAQLGSTTDVVRSGVLEFALNPFLWSGLVAGFVISRMTSQEAGAARWRTFGPALTCGLILVAAAAMIVTRFAYLRGGAFVIFGAASGMTLDRAWQYGVRDAGARAGALVLLVAWSGSVSLGYKSPALLSGALATYLLGGVLAPLRAGEGRKRSRGLQWAVAALAGLLGVEWGAARLVNIYCERPAWELVRPLDRVLAGASHLRTNPRTYALMADLSEAIRRTNGRTVAIVPDCTAYWVKAEQRNPLSISFVNSWELPTPGLYERIVRDLESLRGHGSILVNKIDAYRLAREGFIPLGNDEWFYPIVGHVRSNFRKIGETRWFEIYE
jgi:hypothetical protein